MREAFDIHEHRHKLKQLRDSDDTKLFENLGDVKCPVCQTVFRRIFVTTNQAVRFPEVHGSVYSVSLRRSRCFDTDRAV